MKVHIVKEEFEIYDIDMDLKADDNSMNHYNVPEMVVRRYLEAKRGLEHVTRDVRLYIEKRK